MIHGIPTDKGLEILNSELKKTANTFALVGAPSPEQEQLDRLVGRDPATGKEAYTSDLEYSAIEDHIYHRGDIDIAYYDEEGLLTFEINLGNLNTDQYLFGCLILGNDNAVIVVIPLPKLILSAEVGGVLTIKFAIKGGNPGEIIFLNRDFPSYAEWEVFKKSFTQDFNARIEQMNAIKAEFEAKLAALEQEKAAILAQQTQAIKELEVKLAPDAFRESLSTTLLGRLESGLDGRIQTLLEPKQGQLEQALEAFKARFDGYKQEIMVKFQLKIRLAEVTQEWEKDSYDYFCEVPPRALLFASYQVEVYRMPYDNYTFRTYPNLIFFNANDVVSKVKVGKILYTFGGFGVRGDFRVLPPSQCIIVT
ncbi:hypothetical protein [Helicobacter salomonis]|uniref:hypothetical protein n=1 Tax=Helicobacter salomonis TaxID=56878 RepID=UPI000CF13C7E|nr:hypothetical protein [Helicobacter salomonis]